MKNKDSWMAKSIPYNDKISFIEFSENFTTAIMEASSSSFSCYIMVETTKNIPYIHEIKASSLLNKYYAINVKDHCKGFKDSLELYNSLKELYELDNILLVMIVDNNVLSSDDEDYNKDKGYKLLSMWHDKKDECRSYLFDSAKMSFKDFRKSTNVFDKFQKMSETGTPDDFLNSEDKDENEDN